MLRKIIFLSLIATVALVSCKKDAVAVTYNFDFMGTTTATGRIADASVGVNTTVKNNGTASANLRWKFVQVDGPSQWVVSLCDNVTCWPPTTTSQNFVLAAGENGRMLVDVAPNGVAGTGHVNVLVWAPSDSASTVKIEACTVTVNP